VGYLTSLLCFVGFCASIVSQLSLKPVTVRRFEDLVYRNYEVVLDFDVYPKVWAKELPV
jgi:hypothetical protein